MAESDEALRARDRTRPLAGRRVVVTRPLAQARALADQIEELGGEVVEFPSIDIEPPEDFAPLDTAVGKIEAYHWLIFTSVNGVEAFLRRFRRAGKSFSALARVKVVAIGPETAKRLEASGMSCSLMPERYQAEGILEAIPPDSMAGKRVLMPRAAEAREVLPETLRRWGATVDVVAAYRTVLPRTDVRRLRDLLREGKIDVVTFTSSSTVRNFVRLFGGARLSDIAAGSAIACIGPVTAEEVGALGGRADILAQEFTTAGLLRAIVDHFSRSGA